MFAIAAWLGARGAAILCAAPLGCACSDGILGFARVAGTPLVNAGAPRPPTAPLPLWCATTAAEPLAPRPPRTGAAAPRPPRTADAPRAPLAAYAPRAPCAASDPLTAAIIRCWTASRALITREAAARPRGAAPLVGEAPLPR